MLMVGIESLFEKKEKMFNSIINRLFLISCLAIVRTAIAVELPEGISYSHIFLSDQTSVHVLEVNPHFFDIIPVKNKGDVEAVSSMAKRHKAIAAVNGGFFKMKGEFADLPMGILKIDNHWYGTPHKPRGAIGWSHADEKVLFDQILTQIYGYSGNAVIPIDGINRILKDQQVILCTPHIGKQFDYPNLGLQLLIKDQKVSKIEKKRASIPADGVSLMIGVLKTLSFPPIAEGDDFEWDIHVTPQSHPPYTKSEEWSDIVHIVGGTPILVRGGRLVTDFSAEQTGSHFLNVRLARTAVGILENGNWLFVVVDGFYKNIWNTKGITIPDLAELMQKLGCVEALNLCGGKCSTMVLKNVVVNDPPDGTRKGRKVSDALVIIPKNR
jgi:exopolysaccharide biosynthesis protein